MRGAIRRLDPDGRKVVAYLGLTKKKKLFKLPSINDKLSTAKKPEVTAPDSERVAPVSDGEVVNINEQVKV